VPSPGLASGLHWGHDTSLVERLDNTMCRIPDIADFGVPWGAVVALLMGEYCSGCCLRDIVSPPSSLLDEGFEDMLEGYDEVASRVMLRVLTHDIVCDVC
jgi:hypothetical protein